MKLFEQPELDRNYNKIDKMTSDILTKALDTKPFCYSCTKLLGMAIMLKLSGEQSVSQ